MRQDGVVDLDAFRWLLTAEGRRLLERAAEVDPGSRSGSLSGHAALRRTASAEHVAAALTQVELRRRAVAKFGDDAARMFFTPEGLEQATRAPVATHRAARARAASAASVVDLGGEHDESRVLYLAPRFLLLPNREIEGRGDKP